MARLTPSSLHRRASTIAPFTAWFASGAGMMLSARANRTPASKQSSCVYAVGSTRSSCTQWLTSGAMPW